MHAATRSANPGASLQLARADAVRLVLLARAADGSGSFSFQRKDHRHRHPDCWQWTAHELSVRTGLDAALAGESVCERWAAVPDRSHIQRQSFDMVMPAQLYPAGTLRQPAQS